MPGNRQKPLSVVPSGWLLEAGRKSGPREMVVTPAQAGEQNSAYRAARILLRNQFWFSRFPLRGKRFNFQKEN